MLSNHALKPEGAASNAPARLPRLSLIQTLARGLDDCRTPERLRAWLQGFAHSLGFYGARYIHLGHLLGRVGGEGERRPVRFLSTASRESGRLGVDGWGLADPVLVRARGAFTPFSWSTRPTGDLEPDQLAWLKAERSRGIGAGVAVPVQDYAAGPAYLSLFGVDEPAAEHLVRDWAPDLAHVGVQVHVRAQVVLQAAEVVNAQAALTPREIECLRLAANGWTVAATAEALGIVGRTVEFHLANASAKIGAVNKIHAVAIAAGERLIRI